MATQPTLSSQPAPAKVFMSYAHADEPLLNELKKHVAALRRQGVISTWNDRDISAGTEWASSISKELEENDVILLLISPDFIASEYCSDIETRRAMERHDAGEALVIPVFLRPCDWKGEVFGKLQGLPTDARPVTHPSWSSRDEAFTSVATGMRNAISAWQQRRQIAAHQPHASTPPASPPEQAMPAPAFRMPKLRSTGFNPYQATREILSFIDAELTSRMGVLEKAGYLVDRDASDGATRFRLLAGGQTVYFLDMWKGGFAGNDNGMSFCHGRGRRGIVGGSTTATATPVPDDYTGTANLDVLNISLLDNGIDKKIYTKEEFVDAVWIQIITALDQSQQQ